MEKLIIQNETSIPLVDLMPCIESVLRDGKISGEGENKQYCYATIFKSPIPGLAIYATKNKKSDRLIIRRKDV